MGAVRAFGQKALEYTKGIGQAIKGNNAGKMAQ